jgi:glycogen operon protein
VQRLYGSDDLFPDDPADAYRPFQSVNFVTAHDGFTLYDLVSYNQKHNEANGQNNTDGSDDNRSWNCGFEGDQRAPADVLALRRRQVRNFFALLMLSNGTPMFCAGDEFLATHHGNNNPYNQDNEINYLDWDLLETNHGAFRFFQGMIAFRKQHPSIARSQYWREDVSWYGGPKREVDFGASGQTLAYCLHGASHNDADIYVMINGSATDAQFHIYEGKPEGWQLVADTGLPSPADFIDQPNRRAVASLDYKVGSRSVVVLVAIHYGNK